MRYGLSSPKGSPQNRMGEVLTLTTGWAPGCACEAGEPVPCTVLDPFSGAGTTGVVAGKLGRDYVGVELNPAYAETSERRILREVGPLLVTVDVVARGEVAS